MATVRITYFGMDGEGRTVTEAKQDAGRRIERALDGSYTPELARIIGPDGETLEQAVIYRTPRNGWEYTLLNYRWEGQNADRNTVPLYGSSCTETLEECRTYAIRHMANLALHWDTSDEDAARIINQVDRGHRAEMWRNLGFQRAMHAWTEAGADTMIAHHYATWYGGPVFPPMVLAAA